MNEIDRIVHLPVRLKYSLSGPLKDMLNVALAQARLSHEVSGMIQAVAQGYERWGNFVQGMDTDIAQAKTAYLRTLAIAVPDLFVVSWDHNAFPGYQLDENEQKVLDSSREEFNAKVAVAEVTYRLFGKSLPELQSNIIKQSPLFQELMKGTSTPEPSDKRGRHRTY